MMSSVKPEVLETSGPGKQLEEWAATDQGTRDSLGGEP